MNDSKRTKALRNALANPCFEIIPLKGIEQKVDHIPPGSDVAITCSPDKGIWATMELTRQIGDRGFNLIPHIAARMVSDETHLRNILRQLDDLGVHRILVVAGDTEKPVGIFDSSLQLLEMMATIDHGIDLVGVGAYPEGHPLIDDPTLLRFLQEKQRFAVYMVTQMCFDPKVVGEWLKRIRSAGVELPVHIGVPGVAERTNLLRIALKIGVGRSARFLQSNLGLVGKMMAPGGYSPDELLLGLAPSFNTTPFTIDGIHLFTFNQIESTEKWRAAMLARLDREMDVRP